LGAVAIIPSAVEAATQVRAPFQGLGATSSADPGGVWPSTSVPSRLQTAVISQRYEGMVRQ
jgi:hypothetical protein